MPRHDLTSPSRTASTPAAIASRRRHPSGARVGENPRPPRYRLLTAAAALPQRSSVPPSESFERDCPACGQLITFTQIHGDTGIDYAIEEHDCLPIERDHRTWKTA